MSRFHEKSFPGGLGEAMPHVYGQPRHADLTWPLWNLLDLTPEGRGTDWHPDYQK